MSPVTAKNIFVRLGQNLTVEIPKKYTKTQKFYGKIFGYKSLKSSAYSRNTGRRYCPFRIRFTTRMIGASVP